MNYIYCGVLAAFRKQVLELEVLGKTLLENMISYLGGKRKESHSFLQFLSLLWISWDWVVDGQFSS